MVGKMQCVVSQLLRSHPITIRKNSRDYQSSVREEKAHKGNPKREGAEFHVYSKNRYNMCFRELREVNIASTCPKQKHYFYAPV